MLITLVFQSGANLKEQVLADMLGVSRTPVREALQRLIHEGWASSEGKRLYVCPVTLSSIDEIFQLRFVLEPFAAAEVMAKGRSRTLAGKLDEVLNVMEQVMDDRVAFARLDMQFHTLLMTSVENERLNRFWKTLHEESSRIAIMNLTAEKRFKDVIDEHARMIEAFWQKDAESVRRAVSEHLTKSRNALAARLEKTDERPETPESGIDDKICEFILDDALSKKEETLVQGR
jgi:DNA-binding GntR family transcriptional regulator